MHALHGSGFETSASVPGPPSVPLELPASVPGELPQASMASHELAAAAQRTTASLKEAHVVMHCGGVAPHRAVMLAQTSEQDGGPSSTGAGPEQPSA